MADKESKSVDFRFTLPVRLVWGYLAQPKPPQTMQRAGFNAPSRYEATFLIPTNHADLASFKATLKQVAKDMWGDNIKDVQWPVSDGDERADKDAARGKEREFFRGNIVLATHSDITRADGTPLSPPVLKVLTDQDEFVRFPADGPERRAAAPFFYSGVFVVPAIRLRTWDIKGKYVTAYINEVLSLKAGDRIATGEDDVARYGKPETFAAYRGTTRAGANPAGAELDDDLPI